MLVQRTRGVSTRMFEEENRDLLIETRGGGEEGGREKTKDEETLFCCTDQWNSRRLL